MTIESCRYLLSKLRAGALKTHQHPLPPVSHLLQPHPTEGILCNIVISGGSRRQEPPHHLYSRRLQYLLRYLGVWKGTPQGVGRYAT